MQNGKSGRRGPLEISGQDGSLIGNQVNAWDGSISINKYGMNHNTRISYEETLTADKTYDIWEDLGKPIYFEVNITTTYPIKITLIGDKNWASQTDLDRVSASVTLRANETVFIYDEEFKSLSVERVYTDESYITSVSIYASGFIPDNNGVNQYRNREIK